MPYKSQKQRGFFDANRKKLEAQGVDVDEWNQASAGKSLPVRAKKTAFPRIQARARAMQGQKDEEEDK